MKRSELDKAIEKILFEDMSFGLHSRVSTVHDRPVTSGQPDPNFKPNPVSTVQPSVPIRPTELMATQLADERPPIEDDEYSPVSVPALKAAVAAIADLVPPDQVTRFYRRAQELLDDAVERQAEGEIAKSAEVEEEMNPTKDNEEEESNMSNNVKRESVIRRQAGLNSLISLLREAINPYDAAVAGSGGDEFDTAISPSQNAGDDEVNKLEDIAKFLEMNSPSGARQYIERLLTQVRERIKNIGKIESLVKTAAVDYARIIDEMGLMQGDELDKLLDADAEEIAETDAFRFYLGDIASSSLSESLGASQAALRALIASKEGIPDAVRDTVYNQITGGAAKKDSTLIKRMMTKVGMTEEEANTKLAVIKSYYNEFENSLKGASQSSDTKKIIQSIEEKLRMPDKNKAKLIINALQSSEEFDSESIVHMITQKIPDLLKMAKSVDPMSTQFSKNLSYLQSQLEDMKNDIDTMNLQARTQDPEIRSAIDGYHRLESAVQELQNKEMSV